MTDSTFFLTSYHNPAVNSSAHPGLIYFLFWNRSLPCTTAIGSLTLPLSISSTSNSHHNATRFNIYQRQNIIQCCLHHSIETNMSSYQCTAIDRSGSTKARPIFCLGISTAPINRASKYCWLWHTPIYQDKLAFLTHNCVSDRVASHKAFHQAVETKS